MIPRLVLLTMKTVKRLALNVKTLLNILRLLIDESLSWKAIEDPYSLCCKQNK